MIFLFLSLFFQFSIQAFDRLCCIIYPKRFSLRSHSFYFCLILIQWIISICSVIPVIVSKQIVYNPGGHFCQINLRDSFAFPCFFLVSYLIPLICIVYIYVKIIIYLRRRSIMERFRRRKSLNMLRHIIYMLIILIMTGVPILICFIQNRISARPVLYYGQKLNMIYVTFSHSAVMIYTLLLAANARRSLIRSIRVPYQMTTQIQQMSPIEIHLPRLAFYK